MTILRTIAASSLAALTCVLTLAVTAAPAQAQATRTWVSGVGDDVNPCSRTAPCKTFAGAISKTAASGEINCLDPGGYGTLTITKSITVDCTGTFGSSLNSGGINGFIINDSASATPNTAEVVLRGLSINGSGTTLGLNGVRFIAGKSLLLKDVIIQGQSNSGVLIGPGAAARVALHDVTITETNNGVIVQPTGAAGFARVHLSNVRIYNNNGTNLKIDSAGNTSLSGNFVTVENSEFANGVTGISLSALPGTNSASLVMNGSAVLQNSTGISANGSSSGARVGNTTIFANGTGIAQTNGGTIVSYGDNRMNGNGVDGTFFGIDPKK